MREIISSRGGGNLTDQSDEIDLAAVWLDIKRHKLLVAAFVLVFAVAAATYAILTPSIYRAQAVIAAVRESSLSGTGSMSSQLSGLASLAGVDLGAGGDEERQFLAVLRSRHLVEEFIRRNNLIPVLFPKPNPENPPTMWRAVERFKGDVLDISEDTRRGTLTVSMDWTDAATAALWSNSFVALANDLIRTHTTDESQRNIKFLNDQVSRTNVVELQRVFYTLIEGETKTLMLASGRPEYAFRVVDPAVAPELRVKPHRTLLTLGGAALGFFLGSMFALWREGRRGSRQSARPAAIAS